MLIIYDVGGFWWKMAELKWKIVELKNFKICVNINQVV